MPVPTSKTLFRNVSILDSTGARPYPGDVLVDGDRIAAVGTVSGDRTTVPGWPRVTAAR
jgi:predicted amidohydrolase YtcJ